MNRTFRLYAAVTLLALFVAGCSGPCESIKPITAPAAGSGSADFTHYVAMGTSIAAGTESGGLVTHHQAHAYPALFARQVGMAPFTYPAVSADGQPPLLQLVSISPLVISNAGRTPGTPLNFTLPTPYDNMGVPGALLVDAADSVYYYSNPFGRGSAVFDLIVRHRGTILQQVASLGPTFVSFEYGANEVLGPATSGSGTPAADVPTFTYLLNGTLTAMAAAMPDAKLAIFNVPDVTSIPYVTTIKPYVVGPGGVHIALLTEVDAEHPAGTVNADDYVLLPAAALLAAGTGLPVAAGGNGDPLPASVVLSADEAASITAAVAGYNSAIAAAATAHGAALVDLHGLLQKVSTTGVVTGGVRYSSAFISGGIFSLDGVHPTDLGHGFIANTMIAAVNVKFGASIPLVDLREAATWTSSEARPALGEITGWPQVEGLDQALGFLGYRR